MAGRSLPFTCTTVSREFTEHIGNLHFGVRTSSIQLELQQVANYSAGFGAVPSILSIDGRELPNLKAPH